MRVTRRDVALVRDLALSHVLSRDQIISLGYFASVTRVNTRLRELADCGLVARLDTPFFRQSLYVATKRASEVVGERISPLMENRSPRPRFIQHALSVTNVRLALLKQTKGEWRFEQQLWRQLPKSKQRLRPDGLFLAKGAVFVEVDLGHVAPAKFREKLLGYRALARSGSCNELYGFRTFRLLTVTTGPLRSSRLNRLQPSDAGFDHRVMTFDQLGATAAPNWS